MTLRPYQSKLIDDTYSQWQAGHRRVLAQLPTGGGKTHLFSNIANDITNQGGRSLILAHREELITQAAAKLHQATGESVGIIKAGYDFEPRRRLQVASVQSLINRLDKTSPFDLVVTDEAHHGTAATYQSILSHYSSAAQLGVTATPIRSDGSGFRDVFDSLVCGPSTADLIKQGHLCKYRLIADATQMSVQGVRSVAGEYNQRQLAAVNDEIKLAGSIVGSYRELAAGKRAIVFAINCQHSKAITAAYNAASIPAVHLDGNSSPEERRAALAAFAAGDLKVLSNCALFTEGFDLPSIEVVQIAKPTKSLSLWLQMLGRDLRPAPGKAEALLIDHTDNWRRLGSPVRPRLWTLDGVEVAAREMKRGPHGEVEESEPIMVTETAATLKEIVLDELAEWRAAWNDIRAMQQQRKYKPGWLVYQLRELKPPLEVWELAAADLGYKRGWAWHQFQQTLESAA